MLSITFVNGYTPPVKIFNGHFQGVTNRLLRLGRLLSFQGSDP